MRLIKLTLTLILITSSVCHRCFGQIEYLFTDAVCEEEMKITTQLFGHDQFNDEQRRRDVLRDAENAVKNETDPMRAAGSLARLYRFYEIFRIPGGQDRCVQQIVRLSERTDNIEIYVRATVMQAQNMIRIRDYSAAIECYKNGISHLEQIGATPQIAKLHCYLGYAYNLIRNDVLSTHSLNEAVDIVEAECNDPLLMGEVYLHAAIIYQSDSAYVKASGYIAGAMSIFDRNLDSPNRMYSNLRNIATIVSADIKLETNHSDEAIGMYEAGIEKLLFTVKSAMHSDSIISFSSARTSFKYLSDGYNGLGKAYQNKGDLEKAYDNYMKALELRNNLGAIDKIIDSYISISRYYMHRNMLDSVYYYAKKGFEIADEIEDDQNKYHASIILSEMFKKRENYKNAYEYLAIAREASLARSDMEKVKKKNREELEEVLKSKNSEALQKTDQVKKVSNWMAAFVAMAVASSIVIGILFMKKKKKNRLLSEQRDTLEQHALLLQKQQEEISQKNQELRATTEMLEERNKELYRLSIVASITNNSIFIADIEGNIIWFNDSFAKRTGYNLDQIGSCTDLASISASIETKKAYDSVLATKQAKVFVARKTFKNGSASWMQTSVTPVLDENKNVTMFVLVCTDVTELRKAYDKIDAQNKEINDSIAYARKIQDAVQPLKIFSDEILGEHFLINMPRNVVSGDFHWVGFKNGLSVFTVADCTGHGVPGAFISILGQVMLNQTLNQIDNVNASQMLNLVRHGIIHQLHQRHKDGVLADSIDASMFVYDRDNCVIDYAGAYSNAYILRFGTPDEDTIAVCDQSGSRIITDVQYPGVYLIHLKTNRMTLGIDKRDTIPFSNIKLKVAHGDIAYATTDGFPDQFGGEKQKRFNISNFEKLLLSCCTLPMEEQRKKMERIYLEWKGDYEQTDDVHVLGIVL